MEKESEERSNELGDENLMEATESYEHYRFVADPKQTPIRIDKFLLDRMEKVSRNRIQQVIKAGAVLVNGKEIKTNFKIKPGHVITIELDHPPRESQEVIPQDIPLDIRYEDDYLMIVHKPAGMVVHPGVGTFDGTLVNALAYYFKSQDLPILEGNPSNRPGLVHRIDKNTSGLLVVAKTPETMTHLAKQFFNHTIKRSYQALIWGELDDDEGTIDLFIGRDPKNPKVVRVFPEGDHGKRAITHYKVLERLYYVSLIECQLETGRTHQIRIHMKSQGNPIFSDDKYGGDRVVKGTVFTKYKQFVENCFKLLPRQALHAKSLGFVHPATGEEMYFESELPPDFQAALEKWQKYVAGRKDVVNK